MWRGARVLVLAALGLLAGPSVAELDKKFNITIGYLPAVRCGLLGRQGPAISGALSMALEEVVARFATTHGCSYPRYYFGSFINTLLPFRFANSKYMRSLPFERTYNTSTYRIFFGQYFKKCQNLLCFCPLVQNLQCASPTRT